MADDGLWPPQDERAPEHEPVRVNPRVDPCDRDRDGPGAGVQHALDRRRRPLVEGLDPETAEHDAERRRERDKGCEPKRAHARIVSTAPDDPRGYAKPA